MTKVYYIDPMFKEALEKVPPVIRKEVGFSFDIKIHLLLIFDNCSVAMIPFF